MQSSPTTLRPRPAWPRRARAAAAMVGVSAATLLAGCSQGVGAADGPSPRPDTSVNAAAPAASSSADPVAAAALESLLTQREQALAAGDRTRFAATVAAPGSPAGRAQLASFDTAVALDLARLTHDAAFTEATPAAPRSLVAVLRYRVAGVDTADRTATVAYRLSRSGGVWRVAGEEPTGAGSTAPWLALPGATVERSAHAVVAGTVGASRLRGYAAAVDRARADLGTAWTVPETVLVLAPSTADEADVLLGRSAGGAPVAATTEGPVGAGGIATGDRIVLDPDAFERLTAAGRQVVVAHELAHVAVRASVGGAQEAWVSEGWADHVGYAYAGVPQSRLVAPLVAAVRAGQAPLALPGAGDVDPGSGDIEVPYLAAWQAIELLVEGHGEEAVRRFVVAASSTGTDEDVHAATDRALRDVLGTTREDLTRDWQARLRSLAR